MLTYTAQMFRDVTLDYAAMNAATIGGRDGIEGLVLSLIGFEEAHPLVREVFGGLGGEFWQLLTDYYVQAGEEQS